MPSWAGDRYRADTFNFSPYDFDGSRGCGQFIGNSGPLGENRYPPYPDEGETEMDEPVQTSRRSGYY